MPPPTEPFTFDVYYYRWPSGAEKCELLDGSLLFSGEFDERDAVIAGAAFPGRVVEVDGAGLWVRPGAAG